MNVAIAATGRATRSTGTDHVIEWLDRWLR
jgi:hypothetical protein